MGMGGIGNNSNIERLSNIQKGDIAKTGGKGTELQLPSPSTVSKELASGRSEVNVGDINASIADAKEKFSNDIGGDFKGAVNSPILAPLASDGVSSAAKKVAEVFKNSDEQPTLGELAGTTLALTFLESEKDKK